LAARRKFCAPLFFARQMKAENGIAPFRKNKYMKSGAEFHGPFSRAQPQRFNLRPILRRPYAAGKANFRQLR